MLAIHSSMRIFVATDPTDMRKGFDGLYGVVTGVLEQDPLSGHLFLFLNHHVVTDSKFYTGSAMDWQFGMSDCVLVHRELEFEAA